MFLPPPSCRCPHPEPRPLRPREENGREHADHLRALPDLKHEVVSIVGLLTDEIDFHAMLVYRTFAFDDYATYLSSMEELLRDCAAQGADTRAALFDPQEFAAFCAESGLAPDSPRSRARYTAELASAGPTVPYEGQPLADLIPPLVESAVREATVDVTVSRLAALGGCAVCGEDLGRAAYTRAANLVVRILASAPPGQIHLVASIADTPEQLLAGLHAGTGSGGRDQEQEPYELTMVLALGLATRARGGLILRTTAPGT
ncbi:hypothetical protein, partial [Streptomyces formicae]